MFNNERIEHIEKILKQQGLRDTFDIAGLTLESKINGLRMYLEDIVVSIRLIQDYLGIREETQPPTRKIVKIKKQGKHT